MGTEGTRARSHAHGKRHGRITVHVLIVILAVCAVTFAAKFPNTSSASSSVSVPSFSLSGVTGSATQARSYAYFRPGSSNQTRESVAALELRSDALSIRAAGGVSPTSALSSGVSAAAAISGEQGAGLKPLADIVDPRQPFALYTAQPGDSTSLVAEKFGISLRTLLDNNLTVGGKDGSLLPLGAQLLVPRKDGILYKVSGSGDTSVAAIVKQYDNITEETILAYKPNAIADASNLKAGDFVLLPGATVKPPPPPPPPPPARTGSTAPPPGTGAAAPGGNGRFHYPLAKWKGVSDEFGSPRGSGTYHTGIDLDLYGLHGSPIYSACDGVVTKTEYLTYSYGYHVIIDCGDGWTTLYAHMSEILASPGQKVSAGTQIGVSGSTGFSTGEHLHFEIRFNGGYVDPANYLGF
jgi:murein DD-endopeptidase MepM/ murein hydrolase activator NlpD